MQTALVCQPGLFECLPGKSSLYRKRRAASLSASLLLHGTVILFFATVAPVAALMEPETEIIPLIFAPPPSTSSETQARPGGMPGISRELPHGIELDLTGVKLSILDDPGFEMLKVLERHNGYIGFAAADHPEYLTNLFRAGDWHPVREGTWISRTDFFTFRFPNPGQWPILARLRERFEIESGAVPYALFPASFQYEVNTEIEAEAARRSLHGHAVSAVIRFSRLAALGIVVENLEVATAAKGGRTESSKSSLALK